MIRLVDGTGGGGSTRTLSTSAKTHVPEVNGWQWPVANMGAVPVVALALGPCAGLGAARVAASHFAVSAAASSTRPRNSTVTCQRARAVQRNRRASRPVRSRGTRASMVSTTPGGGTTPTKARRSESLTPRRAGAAGG